MIRLPLRRGVRALVKLTRLRNLNLSSGMRRAADRRFEFFVDDEGFVPVARSSPLEELAISVTNVSIESLQPLLAKGQIRILLLPHSFSRHIDELLA